MIETPALTDRGAGFVNRAPEPVVVVNRCGQQIASDLIDRASGLRGKTGELRLKTAPISRAGDASLTLFHLTVPKL